LIHIGYNVEMSENVVEQGGTTCSVQELHVKIQSKFKRLILSVIFAKETMKMKKQVSHQIKNLKQTDRC